MKKHTSIRFTEKILALLNDDATKNEIKLSEQVRRIVEKHYEKSGLPIGEKFPKIPQTPKVVPQTDSQKLSHNPQIVPQKRNLIMRQKTQSPDDIIYVNGKPTLRRNIQ